jgi:hypothetical protein
MALPNCRYSARTQDGGPNDVRMKKYTVGCARQLFLPKSLLINTTRYGGWLWQACGADEVAVINACLYPYKILLPQRIALLRCCGATERLLK